MRLTKDIKKEVTTVYETYWKSYLSGDIDKMATLLADDFNVIGSTAGEIFHNKKEVLKYYSDSADQIKDKLKFRNRNLEFVNYDQLLLINEHSDAYILIDKNWTLYSKVRLSSLLKRVNNVWKFVQQHGSIPDSKAQDGEQIAFDKISKENLELREAVNRRTIELEHKNNELKIEASLERIRTIAMSMQKAEGLLDVVEILYTELKTLGFTDIRNTIINIFNDAKELFLNYDYSDYGVGGISEVNYNSHPSNKKLVNKMRKASKDFMITEFTGSELDEWRKWRSDQGQMPDPKLDQAKSLYYYEYSIGVGTIGISTFSPINADQLEILNKIRNVFDLAYRRYTDIAQAEAQAREAKIEAALEKVRARTMGMQHSDELPEAANLLFLEVQSLGIPAWSAGYNVLAEDKKSSDCWMSSEGAIQQPAILYFTEESSFIEWYDFLQSKETFFVQELGGLDIENHYNYLRSIPDIGEVLKKLDAADIELPTYQINHLCKFTHGFLLFITYEPVPEAHDIFKRFAKVFQQTYTRFLDLQKAEAQAREAKIEAGLERVRASAMAMHKSEQLSETAKVLFEEFAILGKIPDRMSIGIINEVTKNVEMWVTDQGGNDLNHKFFFSIEEPTSIAKIYDAWKDGKDSLFVDLTGQNLKDWLEFVKKEAKLPVDESKIKGRRVQQAAFFSHGFFLLTSHQPVADEIMNLLVRFARVFNQTYTRFLDLLKAEEQAREAQIEAALEKVRSRSLAMHTSEELADTATILFEQLQTLGELPDRVGICIINEEQKYFEQWVTNQDGKFLGHRINASIAESTTMSKLYDAWKEKKDHLIIDLQDHELKKWMKFVREDLKMVVDDTKIKGRRIHNGVFFSNGMFLYTTHEPISNEVIQLLIRFVKVFEQAYTRFLDLQKAEAQAREAQIEASLERVRSKTMAMHNSHDMGITVKTLFDQVLKLELDNDIRCGIGILEGRERMETRSATLDSNGEVDLKIGMLDMTIHPMLKRIKNAWKSGGTRFTDQMTGKDVIRYYTALNNEPDYPFHKELDTIPKKEFHNSFSFSEGILFAFSPNPMSEEAAKVLDRFARVFGQTYRRFVDLQKAEAQTREAQIEASLERVRSKAMAMHTSEDLALTIDHFFHELESLNVKPIRCGVGIKDGDSRNVDVTVTSATENGEDIKLTGKLNLGGHPILDKIYEALQLQAEYFPVLRGVEISEYYQVMNPDIEFPNFSEDDVQYGYYFHYEEGGVFAWTKKELLEEEVNIFRRFKSVLSLTYRRYLDLKEAEAQTREAIIETSLERVRARTLAMHKSNELAGTAAHLFSQLNELGIKPYRCNIAIVDSESNNCQLWSTTNHGNVIPTATSIPLDEYSVFIDMYDGWKSKKVDHIIKLSGKERVTWTEYISKYVPFDEYKTTNVNKDKLQNELAIFSNFHFKQGFFVIHTIKELTQFDLNTIQRFAHVFEQTYTRFLDLQNVEAQNIIIKAENERKSEELEEARKLQLAMLPKELPQLPNLEISVYMQTATEVGGDYYDFHVDDTGTLTAVIGDATGHGMKAGTIVTITKSLFNSLASSKNILKIFSRISQVIKDMKFRQLSMCLMMLKIKENQLTLSSAAMPPAFIYRMKSKLVEEIEMKGMPLGAMKDFPYELHENKVESGDTIFLLSDGLPEIANNNQEMYGYDRIMSEFSKVGNKSSQEIISHFKNSASDWVNGNDPDDDVTFVVIKVK